MTRPFTIKGQRFRVGDTIRMWWTNSTRPVREAEIVAYEPERGRCSLAVNGGWLNPRHKAFRCERAERSLFA